MTLDIAGHETVVEGEDIGAVVSALDQGQERSLTLPLDIRGTATVGHASSFTTRCGLAVRRPDSPGFPAGTAPDGSLEPGRSDGPRKLRLTAALLTLVCLAACGGVQTASEYSLARGDEWRQRQAELDAQAIMQGMAQARQRAEQLARTGR